MKIITYIKKQFNDSLYINSIYLMLRSAGTAPLGLVFWIIVARFYPSDEVGLATALISAANLIVIFSKLGFDVGLIRYLPKTDDKSGLINSSLTIACLFTLVAIFIFIASLNLLSPALLFIRKDFILLVSFVIFTVSYCIYVLQNGGIFIGIRSAKFSFIQQIIADIVKISLPISLAFLGILGIFSAWGIGIFVTVVIGSFLFITRVVPRYKPIPVIKKKLIGGILRFSLGNYIADSFGSLPRLLLPLMIVNSLGAEMGAYFYMAFTIASILFMIPTNISFSLLAEGSYNPEQLRVNVIKAIKLIMILLIPAILIILIFGDKILLLFGKEYSENSLELLWLLSFSVIPFSINRIYVTIKRIYNKISNIIFVFVFTAVCTLILSYVLMLNTGLIGIGIAWILSQGTMAIIVGWLVIKHEGWIQRE